MKLQKVMDSLMEVGRAFQMRGATSAKDLLPAVLRVLISLGTARRVVSEADLNPERDGRYRESDSDR